MTSTLVWHVASGFAGKTPNAQPDNTNNDVQEAYLVWYSRASR